jgi:hypothetical protein
MSATFVIVQGRNVAASCCGVGLRSYFRTVSRLLGILRWSTPSQRISICNFFPSLQRSVSQMAIATLCRADEDCWGMAEEG